MNYNCHMECATSLFSDVEFKAEDLSSKIKNFCYHLMGILKKNSQVLTLEVFASSAHNK